MALVLLLRLLLWQGQGLFQTVGIGWGGKGVPSPQKWSENGVDEYKQTEIEEQKYRNIVLSRAFLMLSKGIPPPSPFFEMWFYQVVQAD